MESTHDPPRFNLWTEPWLTAETHSGKLNTVGIEQLLLNATDYRTLFDPSPLVVVSVHRLLVAILQDILQPEYEEDLIDLWEADAFPSDKIKQFSKEYAHRFNLFSVEMPFLQSADIPLYPEKRGKGKAIGYLLQEQTAGTAVTHYNHTYDAEQILCTACCAKGLLTIPAFASSGGAGIRPSINGVPPIYIIPGGETIYHSLLASLTTPNYQPDIADRDNDTPWWRHDPNVGEKEVLLRVGYLHSLTFPARRARLHPEKMARSCTRCGEQRTWGAFEMVFKMGESRPKESAFWRDPFAAYRIRKDNVIPIRPRAGKAAWRDFGSLFLSQAKGDAYYRPSVIDQLEVEDIRDAMPYSDTTPFPFQVIGLRTDMKMKIWEWESSGFLVPPVVMSDADTAVKIQNAIIFAEDCEFRVLKRMYNHHFYGESKQHPDAKKIKGSMAVKNQMLQSYWQKLGDEFHNWIVGFTPSVDVDTMFETWLRIVIRTGEAVFRHAASQLNNGTSAALICEEAVNHCRASLHSYRNKTYPKKKEQT